MRRLLLLACLSCGSGPATATVVADLGSNVNAIALAGTDVYAGTADEKISRVSTTTGAITPFISSEPLESIATNATTVVWRNDLASQTVTRNDLRRAPLGDATQVATVADPVTIFGIDDAYAYFWDQTTISRAPIGGGGAMALATVSNVSALASDGVQLYYATFGPGPDANVYAMPRDGGPATPLAPQAFGGAYDLHIDDANIYLLQASGGGTTNASAWLLAKSGGKDPVRLPFDCAYFEGLALSGDSVYLTCQKSLGTKIVGPSVQRASKDGSSATVIGTVGSSASSLYPTAPAVDATSVYFGLGTAVMKVPR